MTRSDRIRLNIETLDHLKLVDKISLESYQHQYNKLMDELSKTLKIKKKRKKK
jgi:hypothetical protein